MIAIIGLGNPDKKYGNTRHNTGKIFAEYLASEIQNSKFKIQKKLGAKISEIDLNGQRIILAIPETYMNESGAAMIKIKAFYKLKNEQIYIGHDDSDITLGEYKISFNRGSAGHKGVESIIKHLKTKEFWRIRIGIKPRIKNSELRIKHIKAGDLVLKKFTKVELEVLEKVFGEIIEELESRI